MTLLYPLSAFLDCATHLPWFWVRPEIPSLHSVRRAFCCDVAHKQTWPLPVPELRTKPEIFQVVPSGNVWKCHSAMVFSMAHVPHGGHFRTLSVQLSPHSPNTPIPFLQLRTLPGSGPGNKKNERSKWMARIQNVHLIWLVVDLPL